MKKKRIVKQPEIRRLEIMAVAKQLFENQGYEQTPVDQIIQVAGIAKGTFYYYFKTKKDILTALVDSMVLQLEDHFKNLIKDRKLSALEKLQRMLRGSEKKEIINPDLMESVHLVENREMQEALNMRLVDTIALLIAEVLQQGYQEKIFKKEASTQEVQIILAGSQFILDSGLFSWSSEEQVAWLNAIRNLLALLTDTEPTIFEFVLN
jgi:AcrR family transcriptional regulator